MRAGYRFAPHHRFLDLVAVVRRSTLTERWSADAELGDTYAGRWLGSLGRI